MSKSMAIDGIMKIFLMVAVIIVGMSFLMKAFGIDLIGWLMDKFGGLGVPEKGKILYIKADPEDRSGKEVFSMYLTDEPTQKIEHATMPSLRQFLGLDFGSENYFAYFIVKDDTENYKNNCLIYTVDEDDGFGNKDDAFIYYVKPGAIIQSENSVCNSLNTCLSGKILQGWCEQGSEKVGTCVGKISKGDLKECSNRKKGPFQTVNCVCQVLPEVFLDDSKCDQKTNVDERKVEKNLQFGDTITRVEECKLKGGRPETPSKCNLLLPENRFIIQYGLLCDNGGTWRTCKEDSKEQFTGGASGLKAGGKTYKCGKGNTNIYFWSDESTSSTPVTSIAPSGTISVSPSSPTAGNDFFITVTGRDDNQVTRLGVNIDNNWQYCYCDGSGTPPCSSIYNDKKLCVEKWTIRKSSPGTYYYYGGVLGNSGTANALPDPLEVEITQ